MIETCQALKDRADVTRRLYAAFDAPAREPDVSEEALLAAFSFVRGIVAEYRDGGDQIVEACDCGAHTAWPAERALYDDDWRDLANLCHRILDGAGLPAGHPVEEAIRLAGAFANGVLAHSEPWAPQAGARVRLRHDVERYPHFVAPAGATGTVVALDTVDGIALAVRLDAPLDGAETWDNEVHWLDGDNDPLDDIEEA